MFVKAMPSAELWAGEMKGVGVAGRKVLLVNVDGTVRAYEDRCLHLGVPLSEGRLEGGVLICRAHHWEYEPATGKGINPGTARLVPFPVEVRDGDVWVDVDAGGDAARVGPVLEAGSVADAVIAAIRELNPGVEVLDRGAYLRVDVPGRCVVTRAAVEKHLGRPFPMPGELELVMPSFAGKLTLSGREACWEAAP